MALFDVFVNQGEEDWNVSSVSSSDAFSGALFLGVEAADAGTAAHNVASLLGHDVNEAWRVWPSASQEVIGSPNTAS